MFTLLFCFVEYQHFFIPRFSSVGWSLLHSTISLKIYHHHKLCNRKSYKLRIIKLSCVEEATRRQSAWWWWGGPRQHKNLCKALRNEKCLRWRHLSYLCFVQICMDEWLLPLLVCFVQLSSACFKKRETELVFSARAGRTNGKTARGKIVRQTFVSSLPDWGSKTCQKQCIRWDAGGGFFVFCSGTASPPTLPPISVCVCVCVCYTEIYHSALWCYVLRLLSSGGWLFKRRSFLLLLITVLSTKAQIKT